MLATLIIVFRYIFITALVMTYIEIGPGGESVQAIIETLQNELMAIDWVNVLSTVKKHISDLANALLNALAD